MNADVQRIELLLNRARDAEDLASRQLADALARHNGATHRLAELARYETEYGCLPMDGISGVQALKNRSAFLAKLREAVGFQKTQTTTLERQVETVRSQWLNAHREVEKFEELRARCLREMAARETRHANRDMDEFAARRHRNRHHETQLG